jgi:hypothetical protein
MTPQLQDLLQTLLLPAFQTAQKALQLLATENPSNFLPYHNLQHHLTVAKYCLQGARAEGLTETDTQNLLIAAFLHDFGHSGGAKTDAENVDLAIDTCREFLLHNNFPLAEISKITDIIRATQYPYVLEAESLNICQKILRDADLMQMYEPTLFSMNISGLASEMKVSIPRSVQMGLNFCQMMKKNLNTVWAQEKVRTEFSGVEAEYRLWLQIFEVEE